MVDETAAEGERLQALLQNFLRDGRLIRLPAKLTRRPRRFGQVLAPQRLERPGGRGAGSSALARAELAGALSQPGRRRFTSAKFGNYRCLSDDSA